MRAAAENGSGDEWSKDESSCHLGNPQMLKQALSTRAVRWIAALGCDAYVASA
jgi:hypothetical protein